jgi:phage virion morphogenesis protein
VQTALAKLAQQISNKRPLLEAIGEEIKQRTRMRFHLAKSPEGVAWQPLKHANRKPLYLSGGLHDSIITAVTANAVSIGPSGPSVKYAEVHQLGKIISRTFKKAGARQITIPARPYMPTNELPPAYSDAIVRLVEGHLRAGLAEQ